MTNILRNVPCHQYQSSPLKGEPCWAGGSADNYSQAVEIVIVIPSSFLGEEVEGWVVVVEEGVSVLMFAPLQIESNAR